MNNIDRAFQVAITAHRGQTFIDGESYILHVIKVAHKLPLEDAFIVGLLHDVANMDGEEYLKLCEYEFPRHILEAVEVLTIKEELSWQEHIERIDRNDLAREVMLVKLPLLIEAFEKLKKPTEHNLEWLSKYRYALSILEE